MGRGGGSCASTAIVSNVAPQQGGGVSPVTRGRNSPQQGPSPTPIKVSPDSCLIGPGVAQALDKRRCPAHCPRRRSLGRLNRSQWTHEPTWACPVLCRKTCCQQVRTNPQTRTGGENRFLQLTWCTMRGRMRGRLPGQARPMQLRSR
jgi:hypothetical protein